MLDDDARWAGGKVPVVGEGNLPLIEQALAAFNAMPIETSAEEFGILAGQLAVAFPQRISTEDATLRTTLYADNLRDIPPDLLERAVTAWVRTGEFYPRIAELRRLAYSLPKPQPRIQRHRLALLLEANRARLQAAPDVDLVDPAEVAEFLASYGAAQRDVGRRGAMTRIGIAINRGPAREPTEADYRSVMGDAAYEAAQHMQISNEQDAIAAE